MLLIFIISICLCLFCNECYKEFKIHYKKRKQRNTSDNSST